jgi:F-type H+-transporting ATPase subunit epsilon
MAQLQLDIITQEKKVLSDTIDKITAPASMGEVTILPGHIPLFTRLTDGIIKIFKNNQVTEYAVVGGFMDVAPVNKVTVMSDMAIASEEANEQQAEIAKAKAEAAMQSKESEVEFRLAEASLRKAIMELRLARRHKRNL